MQAREPKEDGYAFGIAPGLELFDLCKLNAIEEVSVYCFTQDNTRRPSAQTAKFRAAAVKFTHEIARRGAAVLVLGDDRSALFPEELKPFLTQWSNVADLAHSRNLSDLQRPFHSCR